MKELFEKLCKLNNIKRKDVVEKDYYLHLILGEIVKNEYLRSNLVFKGGTCLIKTYIDYVRFSEDLDFSWKEQKNWKHLSASKIKNQCSILIDEILPALSEISDILGLTFSGDKEKGDEVHISSGGRMVDFYFGYYSEVLGVLSSIKIQLNFLEKYLYDFKTVKLKPYAPYSDAELYFIFKEQIEKYSNPISLTAYDLKEIYIEKCRAILTRKVFKLRDLIDLYFIEQRFGYTVKKFYEEIIQKTVFALDNYERYRKNLEKALKPNFSIDEEIKLLLVEPPKNFKKKLEIIYNEVDELRNELLKY